LTDQADIIRRYLGLTDISAKMANFTSLSFYQPQ